MLSQNFFTPPRVFKRVLPLIERRKPTEHAKLAARQVEEPAQRQLKLLEQWFELERQKIKEEILVAHENETIVEHGNFLNECLLKEVKSRSLNAQCQSSNGFDENLIQKWVNNTRHQYPLIESDSAILESSVIRSLLSGSNIPISEISVNNRPSRTHNEKVKHSSQRQSYKIEKHVNCPQQKDSSHKHKKCITLFIHRY